MLLSFDGHATIVHRMAAARMNDSEFHRIAKALSDPTRFRVLQRVASVDEVHCQVLLKEFGIAPATMSHHLKELQTAGVLRSRKDGQCVVLSVERDAVEQYGEELMQRLALPLR
jgi:ArsR family transcriptional regulator, arsenate/arsenite/antimonite-responsive transcriptional repressor